MKKILLSLMALFGVLAVNAEDKTVSMDFSAQGFANQQAITSATLDANVSVAFDKGTNSNAPKYYTSGTAIRMYGSNSMTVTTTSGVIKNITLTYGASDGSNAITADCGDFAGTEWTGSSEAVTLTISGTSGNRRIKEISVTYGESSSAPVAVESIALTDAAGNALSSYTQLTVTDKMQVKAVVTPSNATNKKVTWEVMQYSDVISFDEATGTVTALAEGQAALVATTEDGEKQAYTTFVVSAITDGTIADFIAAEGKTCYLTGVVSNIKNTTFGNFDLTDESGTIYVYGCLNAAGESKKFAELGINEGDKIKVLASKFTIYAGTNEAVDVVFVENFGPAAPAVTFNVVPGAETFTVTPSDLEARYYVEVQGAGFAEIAKGAGFETPADYYDYLLDEMGEGLEYLTGVQTQSYTDDWYLEEEGDYEIYVFAIDENYKRVSDVSMTTFTYTIPADNTIEAGKYTLTADVALAEGVTEAMVPADFKKYVGTYKSNATLAGDEKSLTIAENDEEGLFTGFEIKGDAVALAADKTITLNGKVFNIRTAADAENGSLAITAEGDNYKMDAANVWYNGMKVATITNIVIAKASSTGIKNVSAVKALNGKFIENGKFVIISNGKKFNAAGVEMK